mmetsp:Transcript_21238/g.24444  ORF Transcript_21238/g.24444 Transcript_21238/m.24444 type:complete len:288 (+) Transcript_21238:135-998(+)|eukprot:CAMPEP_0171305378 /NCGR_PEP_ID=MMETSP0816-20121228/15212_1 /TAXON_ID=420281 /ORGANISM="Proboscia inermis, Strain CCAP1064/1" /LENGTH=287 /DNA_ID=CAMNT_0011786173 /DNA_START=37 /DNA_END=900 /DNA_ORIENTATION=+
MSDASSYSLPIPLSKPSMDVTGGVIIITGGTQGLGLEIAHQLKRNGAKGLVLVSRSANKAESVMIELNSETCTTKFVRADLSKAEDAQSVVPNAAEAMKDIGPITGVVNAAAVTSRGNLMSTTPESFDLQFAINVRAPFLISQGAAKQFIEKNIRGSIVNICSVAAKGGAPFIMGYSCAKSALVTLTKNNAAELAPNGIRVNGVNMGWCLTENEHSLQSEQSGNEKWFEDADKGVPLGRILRPADVASTVVFLLSSASTMMTGSIIDLHPEYPCGMLSTLAEDSQDR